MLRWWSARYANVTEDNQGCSSMPEGLPGLLSKKGTLPFLASRKWPCGPEEEKNTSSAGACRRTKDITAAKSGPLLSSDRTPTMCDKRLPAARQRAHSRRLAQTMSKPSGFTPSTWSSSLVPVPSIPMEKSCDSRIAVGVGDLDSEVELLVGCWLRLSQAEAADIEGVVVVAGDRHPRC